MKEILITGANGFLGHFLVEEFIKDHKVICLLRPETKNISRLEHLKDKVEIIYHDIKQPLDNLLSKIKNVSIILHAAGNPSSEDSFKNPLGVIYDNVLGTSHLLDVSRKLNLEKFVFYAAGESFGPVPFDYENLENDHYNSVSPYAASKASCEEIAISYYNTFNIPISIIRVSNTFGERSQVNRFPVMVINKILNNEVLQIHTGNNDIISGRKWYHAKDVALQTRLILNVQKTNCEKWNSAGIRFLNNLDFANLIANSMNKNLNYKFIKNDRIGNEPFYCLNISKLIDHGWDEPVNIETRINEMIDWYLKNTNWLKV